MTEPREQNATNRAIEATWRIEAPRLIASLTRIVRDISMAEDLAMDALTVASPRATRCCRWKRASR
jgi:predicted RNA polymerase sigma factor